ncbi:MAG TPA: exodeoxyribonuclease VII small subunit [archaeon]|nr:exodeoxyribonuclease VII small subunit [archaeon]
MTKEKADNFESLCRRIEEIVESLEDEQLPLEDSIKLFTEGVDLAVKARQKLEDGEQKVQKLIRKIEGGLGLEDLE